MTLKNLTSCLFIPFLLSFTVELGAQRLLNYFKALPTEACMNLSPEKREDMILNREKYKGTPEVHINKLDTKNGYLSLSGAFEGQWEMCYWNLSNGQRLLGVSFTMFLSASCVQEQLDFFIDRDGVLEQVPTDAIIPPLHRDELYKKAVPKRDALTANWDDLAFRLPQAGKNITVEPCWIQVKGEPEPFKEKLELIWCDGFFMKAPEKGEAIPDYEVMGNLSKVDLEASFKRSLTNPDCPHIGSFGDTYRKIEMHLESVKPYKGYPAILEVTGLSRLGKNITPFKGYFELEIFNYYKDEDTADNYVVATRGNYFLAEDQTISGSGIFSGTFLLDVVVDEDLSKATGMVPIKINKYLDEIEFYGTWKSYRTGNERRCTWGYYYPQLGPYDRGPMDKLNIQPRIDLRVAESWVPKPVFEKQVTDFVNSIAENDYAKYGYNSKAEIRKNWQKVVAQTDDNYLWALELKDYLTCEEKWWER